jgi:RNA polymerase sigma factor (sigma-70 family)
MYPAGQYISSVANMCMTSACDESLVAAAKGGQHSAYAELCRRYSNRTFKTVHRITQNAEDAEDAVQESLMKAFVHLGSFDGRSAFSSWLTRIAINSALMMLRKRRNHPSCSLESFADPEHSLIPIHIEPSGSPEEACLERERSRKLRHAVTRLAPTLRVVMELRQSRDASIEEIAEDLGITVAATKSRLLRGRAALRRSLGRIQRGTPVRRAAATGWSRQS